MYVPTRFLALDQLAQTRQFRNRMMTRDEVRLLVFILVALAVGAGVRWWLSRNPSLSAQPVVAKSKTGWAEPPYVFKSRAVMEKVADGARANRDEVSAKTASSRSQN
jgi:hypothetical protein